MHYRIDVFPYKEIIVALWVISFILPIHVHCILSSNVFSIRCSLQLFPFQLFIIFLSSVFLFRIIFGLPCNLSRMVCIKYVISESNNTPNIAKIKPTPIIPKMAGDSRRSDRLISLFLARPVSFLGISSSLVRYSWICDWVRLTHVLFFTHKHGIIYSGFNLSSDFFASENKRNEVYIAIKINFIILKLFKRFIAVKLN